MTPANDSDGSFHPRRRSKTKSDFQLNIEENIDIPQHLVANSNRRDRRNCGERTRGGLLSSWGTGEQAATKTIGREKFLFLGGEIETISQGDPRSRRPLACIVALVLAVGVFAFFGGEVRAQESPKQPYVAVADGDSLRETVEEVAGMAAKASPPEILLAETPLVEMLPSEALPAVSVDPLAQELPDDLVRIDPALQQDPTPTTFDRYGAGTPSLGLASERGIPGDPGTMRGSKPLPVPEAVHAPPAGERPPVSISTMGAHPATFPRNGVVDAVPVGLTPSTAVRGMPVPLAPDSLAVGDRSSPSPEVAVSSATGNLQSGVANAATNVVDTRGSTQAPRAGSSPATSSSGEGDVPESASRHERRPSSPLAPLGGSSFSLSSGQAGPGSGLTPLLVCVLASGLFLLRRDGLLFGWAPYEPPKPGSALLLPLERPG